MLSTNLNVLATHRQGVRDPNVGMTSFKMKDNLVGWTYLRGRIVRVAVDSFQGFAPRDVAQRIGRRLYMWGRGERPNNILTNGEQRLVSEIIHLGSPHARTTVVDIGANIGEWSKCVLDSAIKFEKPVTLYAFEPVDSARAELMKRFANDARFRIFIDGRAVGAISGCTTMTAFGVESGLSVLNAILQSNADRTSNIPKQAVNVTTVDEFVQQFEIDFVTLLKSDVEGFDFKVLQGAQETLAQGRIGVMQFEYNHRWVPQHSSLWDVFEMAKHLDYEVCRVGVNNLERFGEWHYEIEKYYEANYALVRADLLERLRHTNWRFTRFNVATRRSN